MVLHQTVNRCHVTKCCLTVLMCVSRTLEIACACSVLSLAILVKFSMTNLSFRCRSFRDSSKSDAISDAPESEPLGDLAAMMTMTTTKEECHEWIDFYVVELARAIRRRKQ